MDENDHNRDALRVLEEIEKDQTAGKFSLRFAITKAFEFGIKFATDRYERAMGRQREIGQLKN